MHVMFFADRGARTAQAIQRAFSIDAATVARMLEQAPVVVKRAATPEVAAALMDVLGPLGAQVVLLPSAAAAVAEDASENEPSSIPRAPSERPVPARPHWGALDLDLATSASHGDEPSFELGARDLSASSASAAASARGAVAPATPGPAATMPMARSADDFAGDEFDLDGSSEEVSIPPLFDPEERLLDADVLEPDDPDVLAMSLPPPVPASPRSSRAAGPLRPSVPTSGSGTDPLSLGPPVSSPVPPRHSLGLGLGSVPPLPGLPPVPPPGALSLPPLPTSFRPPESRSRVTTPSEPPLQLPDLDLDAPVRSPAPPKARPNSAPADSTQQAAHDSSAVGFAHVRADELVGREAPRRRPTPRAESATPRAQSRWIALLELIAGAGALYLGVHLETSVFTGDGTWLSIVAQGFALYGVGAGLAGLRP